ncbi:MAG: tyrosine-type recombinase/integrase [Acidobacteria bacterium]|nr:tyrosine-type recombinase/integrase [Acidobacteriota bacterium]MBI3422144.1 tyrosine-type recombinase/integrase [Acidobacteriota bacterium]
MKARKGYVFKQGKVWVARITYGTPDGKRHNITRNAATKTEATELLDDLRQQYKDYGAKPLEGARLKMAELVDAYLKAKVKPAEYHGDRKVAGMRNWRSPTLYAATIKQHFGKKRIKDVTPSDIEIFKSLRLKTQTVRGKERSIASVNRELELLRAIFSFAKREGWLLVNPFERLEGVISKADETRRERVLSKAEEGRLLDACIGPRAHLKPLLLAALDTGMRKGELLTLRWRNVDLAARTITVTARNSKTARQRTVGITTRLFGELEHLWKISPQDAEELVFGITDNFKRSWLGACRAAGVEGFRFHDSRHTCISRWVASGLPIPEIMRLSGHSTLTAFAIYANATEQTVKRGADALDTWHEMNAIETVSAMVN